MIKAILDPTADQLHACLVSVLEAHAPATRRRISPRALSPWFGTVREEMRAAKRARRRAERQWVKGGLTVHKQIFNAAKRIVTAIAENAKTVFFSAKIAASSTSKELFNLTDMLMAKARSTSIPTVFPKPQLPSLFASYFNSKVNTIRDKLDSQSSSLTSHVETPFSDAFLSSFTPVNCEEVRKFILKCSPKTCQLDAVPTKLLFECIDSVLPAITHVFNHSLESGIFPDSFKKALVKPLLKKPSLDPKDLKNYRPVSNLSFLSKVLEKIVLAQLFEHLSKHSLLPVMQSAYRPHHSTETALLKMVNDTLLALDQNHVTVLTLLDLSCAFDTIDHSILIRRLDSVFGISSTALSWVKSYLTNRTQTIVIDDLCSEPTLLSFGVPQGSVLGPLLFVMYMQPLAQVIASHSVSHVSYADDTQLHNHGPVSDAKAVVHEIERCATDVKNWMAGNKLQLNDEKTEAMIMSTTRISTSQSYSLPPSLEIGKSTIDFAAAAKSLGVTLDACLSLKQHVLNVCRTSYYQLRRISSIRRFLTEDATKTLICCFVLSQLDYCNSLFAGCPKGVIDQLQRVQNSAARLVFRAKKSEHITPMLYKLHWLPVPARIQYKICSLTFSRL